MSIIESLHFLLRIVSKNDTILPIKCNDFIRGVVMEKRYEKILEYVKRQKQVSITEITEYLAHSGFEKCSKFTVLRELEKLLSENKVVKVGKARATVYEPALDIDEYFAKEQDERVIKDAFNFDIWKELADIFNARELNDIAIINEQYRKNREKLTPALLKKELERLTIELSWKSSKIEGNTYSLLDTEKLIKEQKEAAGKKHGEALMILNHKKALDFIFAETEYFEELTIVKLQELHSLLMDGLVANSGMRTGRVGITGTNYRPLDVPLQIKEAVLKLIEVINGCKNPFEKAFIAVLMISYIQPFEDGNKRTGRILGNALLLAGNYCPLSYRSVDETEYKKAIVLFYEQNNFAYFKRLFTEQFKEAVSKYF